MDSRQLALFHGNLVWLALQLRNCRARLTAGRAALAGTRERPNGVRSRLLFVIGIVLPKMACTSFSLLHASIMPRTLHSMQHNQPGQSSMQHTCMHTHLRCCCCHTAAPSASCAPPSRRRSCAAAPRSDWPAAPPGAGCAPRCAGSGAAAAPSPAGSRARGPGGSARAIKLIKHAMLLN